MMQCSLFAFHWLYIYYIGLLYAVAGLASGTEQIQMGQDAFLMLRPGLSCIIILEAQLATTTNDSSNPSFAW
jgi:hypothetical protein